MGDIEEAEPPVIPTTGLVVVVPGDVTSLPIADGFLQPDRLDELEVLAIEQSGNQTISVGFFRTG